MAVPFVRTANINEEVATINLIGHRVGKTSGFTGLTELVLVTDRWEYTYVYLIASGWCTVTLVYSQVLSVPAGDGGLHVQQAPRAGYSDLSEFLCK